MTMTTELETAIRKELRKNHVTFAELARIEGFEGDFQIRLPEYNILLWTDISEEALAILTRMREAGEVHFVPTNILTYLIDGASLSCPVATQKRHYKETHWLPVALNLGPDPDAPMETRPARDRSGSITRRFGATN
jgi:hypothetical protein